MLAILVALLDQASKVIVVKFIERAEHIVVIPDLFHLVHYRNSGAAWGMFRGQSFLLGLLSLIILGVLCYQFRALADKMPERAVSLSFIAGGILGNLVDRFLRGEVVDFLHLFYKKFQWPAFNVADSAITCGVIVYITSTLLRSYHDEEQSSK